MNKQTKTWHTAKLSPLGWLETVIKSVAILIGINAIIRALSNGALELPSGVRLAQFIVLGLLSLGLVGAIFDRLSRREIGSIFFVVFNNLGHWGMLVSLAFIPSPGVWLVVFSALMLAGDLVKLASFKFENFTQEGVSSAILYGLTGFYVAGYALLLALELFS